ncbi:MAG: ScyD/ScyE family protein [Dehalococcoidia bacterium]
MGTRSRTLWLTVFAGLLAAAGIAAFVAFRGDGDSETGPRRVDDPLAGFDRPRTIHFAPDGRLLVTDVGTGEDDGRVIAIDLEAGTREVLLEDLPSVEAGNAAFAGMSGASGAAMASDGTLCVVIGAGPEGRGFSELRCTDGLRVDLLAYERENNPGGGAIESDPFDVVFGSAFGDWYVSDAGANVVLHVSRQGEVAVIGVLNEHIGLGGNEGEPRGLSVSEGFLSTALFGGGVITGGAGMSVPVFAPDAHPIAVAPYEQPIPGPARAVIFLSYGDQAGSENSGSIRIGDAVVLDGLDRPTGFVALGGGRYVVAEEERGRVRIVGGDAR